MCTRHVGGAATRAVMEDCAVWRLDPGPQREIFPGGTKVDTGPPNLFGHQTYAKFIILIFCPKLGEDQQKKIYSKI